MNSDHVTTYKYIKSQESKIQITILLKTHVPISRCYFFF